ncbi:MAG: hypothetical protein ACR2GH_06045 [Pseudonocardia sp.]
MPADNPPSAPEPAYRVTITASTLDDDQPRGQVVVTTTPVFSERLAARSALPGETELADYIDFQRIVVECVGRVDFSRADATRLATTLLLAVTDTMTRGTLRGDDALALLHEITDLHPDLLRLRRLALQSARQAASTGSDAALDTDDPSAS